jgi:hypothetical protein
MKSNDTDQTVGENPYNLTNVMMGSISPMSTKVSAVEGNPRLIRIDL